MSDQQHPRPIAIAPKETPSSTKSTPTANGETCMPYTCLTCARRKVKCDKTSPKCSTCRKASLDCIYQEPAPRKRKRKPVEDIHERLEQYEKILRANDLLPGELPLVATTQVNEPQWPTLPAAIGKSAGSGADFIKTTGKLVGSEDNARYIGSTVFKNLGDELEVSSDEDEGEGGDEASKPAYYQTPAALNDPLSVSLLLPMSFNTSLLNLHPTYETAMKLWKLYVENVDPVVKAVHVPTMQKILQRAAAQPSTVSKNTEVLLFAIYNFAMVTISDEDCMEMFGEARQGLLDKYHTAVKCALVNAQFMKSTSLSVVQAFILYLLSQRTTCDPQTFWILTGVAVRLGQRIGVHRDGDELGLGPFETQMRRRIFWQLLPLDGVAGQMSGTGICITLDSWSTKQPLNLNDNDIWPEMQEQPKARTGATDMMFCLARTEMARIIRTAFTAPKRDMIDIEPVDNEDYKVKSAHLDMLEDELERKYLRYCDFADPVHQLTMAMARAGINGGRLRIRLPRAALHAELPENERKDIWAIATKVLGYHISANTNAQLKRFWWHLRAFFQSDTLVWILNELRRDPGRYQDEDVWSKIQKTYENHPDLLAQKRSFHLAVGRLTMKAWDANQNWRSQNNLPPLPEPAYITTIRNRPSRRESAFPSNGPTPESAGTSFTYNPFNPGDSFTDLPNPNTTTPSNQYGVPSTEPKGAYGAFPMGTASLGSFGGGEGQVFNEFDFGQMVDAGTGTGGVDWFFSDQLVRDPEAFGST